MRQKVRVWSFGSVLLWMCEAEHGSQGWEQKMDTSWQAGSLRKQRLKNPVKTRHSLQWPVPTSAFFGWEPFLNLLTLPKIPTARNKTFNT